MGLDVTVGFCAQFPVEDKGEIDHFSAEIFDVNAALKHAGLRAHKEPENCSVWSGSFHGYSGLHALREVAALYWRGIEVPRDTVINGRDAPNSKDMFDRALPSFTKRPGLFARLFRRKTSSPSPLFMHLNVHSDRAGYYIPIEFTMPLMPAKMNQNTAHIWPVGSVQQLNSELTLLIELLEIPPELTSQSPEIFEAIGSEKTKADSPLWRCQPIAAHSAVLLREACAESMRTGAAIVFH